ncbi:MAG: polymer-forming cytoskeletal protein [Euryarchaeota archaeon]|nr:polymer-forming cytoskeletal protein [Euryarchaeota archaeon]
MKLKEMLRRLDERFANGEISEATYKGIKARYESEADEDDVGAPEQDAPKGERARVPLIKVSGSNDHEGDIYAKEVLVAGSSDVRGNIDAEDVRISGSCDVDGNVKAIKLKVSGSCDVRGRVEADEMRISGACDLEGPVKARVIEISGSCEIEMDVTAERARVSGACDLHSKLTAKAVEFSGAAVFSDVEAEMVEGRGAFDAKSIVAKSVSLRVADRCSVGSIEADVVEVKEYPGGTLDSKTIAGREKVYLEGVCADSVSGGDVEIGPNCRIGVAEGANVKVHPDSKVGQVKKRK